MRYKFNLEIDSENEAFQNGYDEITHILENVIAKLQNYPATLSGRRPAVLLDSNGNTVGSCKLTIEN